VVAGGSVIGYTRLKTRVAQKGDELVAKLDASTGD